MSSTATDTSAPSATVTDAIASASSASRSTVGWATASIDPSPLAVAVTDGVVDDDTASASECDRACTYAVPAAVPPTTAAQASAVYSSGRRRRDGRARRRRALGDCMSAMVGARPVRPVGRTLEVPQGSLRKL
ncbi:hypothetical protein GCM10010129_50200 [Streptomyces fumigatiscleroticus]|nr:hypothetical protein GCM10010129_50200 [Streptomyces fumigatiscleroticus]